MCCIHNIKNHAHRYKIYEYIVISMYDNLEICVSIAILFQLYIVMRYSAELNRGTRRL